MINILSIIAWLCISFPLFALNYPDAKKWPQIDSYHGIKVADPYRWLEDLNALDTRAWIDAENKLTKAYLAQIPARAIIKKRLTQLWNYEKYSAPMKVGTFYIYSKNNGLQNQDVLYIANSINDPGRVFFDPNTLSPDGTEALIGSAFTDDGHFWAYGIAKSGSDRSQWHVRNMATGQDLPDTLKPNRQGNISWLLDNSGFYYSRFPDSKAGDELKASASFQKLYFHKLGTPQTQDQIVYERPNNPDELIGAQVSEDGHWLIIAVSQGTAPQNRVYFKDLTHQHSKILPLVAKLDASYGFIGNDGSHFYFQTNKNAPKGKVVVVNVQDPNLRYTDLIPEQQETLEGVNWINNQLVTAYLKDAYSQIKIYDMKGKFLRQVQLPGIGSAAGFAGKRRDTETFYTYSSFNTPPSIYHFDMKTGESRLFRQANVNFDPHSFAVKQVFYHSKDGTKIPMFIMYKKGMKRNSNNPTILYGYGGFNISLLPGFSVSRLLWMEMGGVYAIANLRGGSEYGEAWHQAGIKLHKQNVFDDFIAAAEWLIANKYTSNKKLAISGASNGGLLVAAVLNQRPSLFGAAIPSVGVMDLLRFSQFTIGKAWEADYGSVDNPKEFKALYAYSPLHQIKPHTIYPATLITTADHDDRVFPAHSFKYAATLQKAQAGTAPILIRIETQAGHGAGKPTSKQIQELADVYAFLVKNLNLDINHSFKLF